MMAVTPAQDQLAEIRRIINEVNREARRLLRAADRVMESNNQQSEESK